LLQGKLDLQIQLGRYCDAVGELAGLVAEHPYSEPFAGLLMRALYGSGRQADALAVYTELRRRLRGELGVEPSEKMRRLHQDVLQANDERVDVGRRSPAARPRGVRNELPPDGTDLVGRGRELARLVYPPGTGVSVDAVDGVAGVGKTA